MPRLDRIHNAVKNAPINDGWKIIHDPFTMRRGRVKLQADLAAEKMLAAEKDGEKIVVEIKSFMSKSQLRELEQAIGQYSLYREYLKILQAPYQIFLALSEDAYQSLLRLDDVGTVLPSLNIAIFTVDLEKEEVIRWIK
jgi:hypothetical protein